MGDFNKVVAGTGALELKKYTELAASYADVGFLKGDVVWEYMKEMLPFYSGLPLQFQGNVTKQITCRLKAPFAQITAANISHLLGEDTITTVAASPVTITMGGANSERTFAAPTGAALEQIILEGPTVASLVVKNQAESVTYTNNTDYVLDATRGVLYRNPGGAISSGATVHLGYQYTPLASSTVKLGVDVDITDISLRFTHTRPQNGKTLIIEIPRARVTGKVSMAFKETDYMITDFEAEALPDTANNPTQPYGYVKENT